MRNWIKSWSWSGQVAFGLLLGVFAVGAVVGGYYGTNEVVRRYRWVHDRHADAERGAQAYAFLASQVELPNGKKVAVADVLVEMMRIAVQPPKAEVKK